MLAGTLVDRGQLDWSDKVQAYVPDFVLSSPEQARRVTIKHLLSHTTGLPYHTYTNLIEYGEDIPSVGEPLLGGAAYCPRGRNLQLPERRLSA